jgi:hypothetical protein
MIAQRVARTCGSHGCAALLGSICASLVCRSLSCVPRIQLFWHDCAVPQQQPREGGRRERSVLRATEPWQHNLDLMLQGWLHALAPCLALVLLFCPACSSRSTSVLLLAFAAAGTVPARGSKHAPCTQKGKGVAAWYTRTAWAGAAHRNCPPHHGMQTPCAGFGAFALGGISYRFPCWPRHSHRVVALAGAWSGMEELTGKLCQGFYRAHPVGLCCVGACTQTCVLWRLLHVIQSRWVGGCASTPARHLVVVARPQVAAAEL